MLRPRPLRTGRAVPTASGSSKPRGLAGGQKSPACDAVKIRCRRRRTRSSTRRQLIDDQSVVSPSGPFTTPPPAAAQTAAALAVRVGMASNLPFGSGVISSRASRAHQIHVSTLSGWSIGSYPASYAGAADGGRPCDTRVPVAFRPPAFACWIFLRPLKNWPSLRSAYQAGCPGPHRGCRVPHE